MHYLIFKGVVCFVCTRNIAKSPTYPMASSSSSSAAPTTTQFIGLRKIEPKEEQMEENDVGEKEQQQNETDGAQFQQQQNSEAPIEHSDNSNDDDDDIPIEGSFNRTLKCCFYVHCYHFLCFQQCQRANKCIVSCVINGCTRATTQHTSVFTTMNAHSFVM